MADTYTVERSAVIPAPREAVHGALVDFHAWEHWSPWQDVDPDMEQTYTGPDAGVGAVMAWKGNRKAGAGRMEITDVTPTSVVVDLQFLKPFKAHNTTSFTLAPEGDGTKVTWTMVGPKTFMTKVMGIFTSMDKMIGPDFEKGLSRLEGHVTA